jgi:SagB-type dehydrogenase family enzyme
MENNYEFNVYHESSKLRENDIELYSWIGLINSDTKIRNVISKPYLSAGSKNNEVSLPDNNNKNQTSLQESIVTRRSNRNFDGEECELEVFSDILKYSAKENSIMKYDDGVNWAFRPYPSGGGLYPIEIYVYVNNVQKLDNGIYYYNPKRHSLSEIENINLIEKLESEMPTLENEIKKSSFIVFLVSNMNKMSFKYMERSYRFALLECGHLAQNILLLTNSYNLKSFPAGAFIDDKVNNFLNLDTSHSNIQYIILNS